MRVIVTGATGFTGGHLARALKNRGHEVRALVRDPAKAVSLEREGILAVTGDLTDADAVRRAADGCDVVYHIAAVYREAKHPDEYYRRINVGGTKNVADAVERGEAGRLVHCSTVGVHGDVRQIPADENARLLHRATSIRGPKSKARYWCVIGSQRDFVASSFVPWAYMGRAIGGSSSCLRPSMTARFA
jgi:nucleoside-diphosphate-sugar epimerase